LPGGRLVVGHPIQPEECAISIFHTTRDTTLDRAAAKLRDADFAARRNVRRIAEALAYISEIQFEIYAARPDLLPDSLSDTKFGAKVLSNKRLERPDARPGARNRPGSGGRSTARR